MAEASDAGTVNTDAGGTQQADANAATSTDAQTTSTTTEGDATKTAETKADDTAATEVEYTFDAPEGIELDQAQLDEFKSIAKELKLPADKAKAIADIAIKAEQRRREAHAEMVEGWKSSVAKDKELGKPENQAVALKAIEAFGTPELKQILNSTGLGNHPEMVRLAYRIGKAISEDAVLGKTTGEAAPRDAASILYGNDAKA